MPARRTTGRTTGKVNEEYDDSGERVAEITDDAVELAKTMAVVGTLSMKKMTDKLVVKAIRTDPESHGYKLISTQAFERLSAIVILGLVFSLLAGQQTRP